MSPENENKSVLLTVKQTAVLLQYRPHTVYGLVANGVLPAVRIVKSLRIRRSDLDAMLHENRTFSRKEALS